MGWTHDYNDVGNRRATTRFGSSRERVASDHSAGDLRLGIPHILRRRARWVSARLRHTARDA
ncbi:hypothetical protein G5C51_27120 [Streptomyces sp. A7024]|uniref:Uncharacterized protein n=1 Tax=Streptomyces coryli TaxID=1128680 RepID=A0A6G4U5P9_9ACTN|nr:hypothetical protein [Streptomyces coryli]NGN67565.1 hypothetical protein [Streptomyces coryli]